MLIFSKNSVVLVIVTVKYSISPGSKFNEFPKKLVFIGTKNNSYNVEGFNINFPSEIFCDVVVFKIVSIVYSEDKDNPFKYNHKLNKAPVCKITGFNTLIENVLLSELLLDILNDICLVEIGLFSVMFNPSK